MPDRDRVGAVVVSYRSAADLPGCLAALLAADGLAAVVVVDNGSDDGSPEIVRAVGDPRVELVEAPRNLGFAGGCNLGLAHLPGDVDVVAFANPDVEVAPDCLARCGATLADDPGLGGVAPRLMRPDGRTVDSVGQVLARGRLEVRDRGYGRPLTPDLLDPAPVLAPCGALAVFARSALERVREGGGPFAEHFFCFWEDLELGWRLHGHGLGVRTVPDAVAVHRRGAGASGSRGPLRWRRPPELEACVLTNRWMTLTRHLHPLDLASRLPLLLVWDFAVVAAGLARRPSLARHLRARAPLLRREWTGRAARPRRRLKEYAWWTWQGSSPESTR